MFFNFTLAIPMKKTELCIIDSKDTEMNNISPVRFQFLPDT